MVEAHVSDWKTGALAAAFGFELDSRAHAGACDLKPLLDLKVLPHVKHSNTCGGVAVEHGGHSLVLLHFLAAGGSI